MKFHLPVLTTLIAAALALPGTAQRVFVVDAAGGAGSQFRELPSAIALARRGDTVIVRAGSYATGFLVSEGISLLGEPGVVLEGSFSVADLPAQQSFTMRGFVSLDFLTVRDCEGLVSLQDLGSGGPSERFTLTIRNSRSVELQRVRAERLDASESELVIASSVLALYESPVYLARGSYTIVDSTVISARNRDALSVGAGDLSITRSLIAARPGTNLQSAAIHASFATILLDPTAVLLASDPSLPTIYGFGWTAVRRELVSCVAHEAANVVTLDLHGHALAPYAVLAGAAATPLTTPFGSLWLDLLNMHVVATGTFDASRGKRHVLSLPMMFPGSEFVTQAVVLGPALELSTPSVVVTR